LEEKIAQVPTEPGVYIMKDREGRVVYVGKAVSLRNRVRSYFNRTGDSRVFVPLLDRLLGDIETVMVSNEKEALLLENELIKKHKPRFNIQLRDDKNFLCLRIDSSHPYPRLEMVRRFKDDGARYFGPYASAASIRETLRIINRYFQLRTCSDHVLANRRRPCILFQIGRCPAPCVYDIPAEEYGQGVREAILFLEGKGDDLIASLSARMKRAAGDLRFEEAGRVRDQIIALERSLERQKIASTEAIDQDVFGLYREADRLLIYVVYVRKGRMAGGRGFPFSGQEFPDQELLASFVNLYYAQENLVPKEVLLPLDPEGLEGLGELLSERKGEKVRVLVPRRGEKAQLVEMAQRNAEQAFQEKKRTKDETMVVLERLQKKLHLTKLPRRMECYDISHFQGANIVASQVAANDGEADRARYRHFKIKSVESQDDFQSMYEVISRRIRRGLEEKDLPDLIVIDGGKGQLASAHAALKDAGVDGMDVVGLAKSLELDGIDASAPVERSPERVFVLGRKDPIVLPQNSPELFMLTRIRDEAHRFAITFQGKLMRRRNFRSVLQDIPGIGEGRKRALLRHFGSLKRIREAAIDDLAEVEGMGQGMAERIHAFLHAQGPATGDAVREASLEDASPE
ncbi:MAG TPA: excinuclease ABC subunit UvrC, partial [Myxococcaceae bacterium]|nr:excinuclease ABC subunit UvrC [Myxococcaceae bacterium]